ncbi:tudor domain-containing protein 1-like [Battus philenor]|uniref:tudor domain-containing protein 1-like n=1 Tax=Battus philenor TaxID=42288 RepID=UPI0035D0F889
MENLYPCPAEFDLASQPAEASLVTLRSDITVVTTAAVKYIETLKDSATELILNICDGAKTAPSGAEVNLTVADTRVSVNKRLQELCTPEWKKMEMNGVDVVEVPKLMYSDLEYLELPKNGCEIEILDISALEGAMVSGFLKGEPLAKKVLEELPKQIEAYCNSEIGKEPYLPKCEELCIAQCPPYSQWFRAVLCEHVDGAGGDTVRVSFVDYGNMESVQVRALRKMLPDFVNGIPALAINLEIRDFPPEPSLEMLARAVQHMKINDEGRGFLTITSCEMIDRGMYVVDAPALIAAMKG